ncbi:MAG: DUF2304 domain-containing protein [Clostridia bacterium]
MIIPLGLVVALACLIFLILVVRQVAHGRLLLKYSLLWMMLALVSILAALFPEPLYALSSLLGFENPSNFIFFAGLFFLLALCLSLSIIVSKQALRIKNLIQQTALIQKRLEEQDSREKA